MRIISKQNDYYDSVQAYGQDQSLIYKRSPRMLTFEELMTAMNITIANNDPYGLSVAAPVMRHLGHEIEDPYSLNLPWRVARLREKRGHLNTRRLLVGFCGQWIPCIKVWDDRLPTTFELKPRKFKTQFYFPANVGDLKDIAPWLHEKYVEHKLKQMKSFLELSLQPKMDLFHALQTPIIVINVSDWGRRRFRVNSKDVAEIDADLSKLQFYRQVDAFSAFQSIEQFLSGVLGVNNPETVTISDKDLRDGKGFDDWSFKKRPSAKK